jgi:hypothetical protein
VSVRHPRAASLAVAVLVAAGVFVATLPAAAVPPGWSGPTRVVTTPSQPRYSMVVDGAGKTHIAAEDSGIVYATNAGGPWTECRISSGNDRDPSIAHDGTRVHIAFARRDSGELGIRTASGTPGGSGSCGWDVVLRHDGNATKPAIGAHAGTIHIAFRTADGRLRYKRGDWDATSWTVHQIVDSTCCQSAPALAMTAEGSPRIAYGDSSADGLRYAAPSGSSWNKRRVQRGRILHVALVLDHTNDPWNGNQPGNAPSIAYVVKNAGTYKARKSGSGTSGAWSFRYFGRYFAPPDLATESNKSVTIYGQGGKIWATSESGAIYVERKISGSGKDGYPQIDLAGQTSVVTFARARTSEGVYRASGTL